MEMQERVPFAMLQSYNIYRYAVSIINVDRKG